MPLKPLTKTIGVLCACLCLTVYAHGDQSRGFVFGPEVPTTLPEPRAIELAVEDAVLVALEANYDISIQRLGVLISRSELMRQRGAFEPELFGQAGRTSATETNSTEESDSGSAGLRTRWVTGTELSLFTEYSEISGSSGGTARAVAELRQPLLRDAGIAVNRSEIVIARRNRELSVNDLKQQMIDTATAVQDQYWGLVAARERQNVQKDSLRFARELADLTGQRAAAGLMGESDTVEAQAAVYARDADVVRAAESVRGIEDTVKEILSLMEDPAMWEAPLIPTTPPTVRRETPLFLSSLSIALNNRPDYQSALLRLKNADLALYVAKNRLLPRLDLSAQAARETGVDGVGSTFDAASSDDDQVWSVFLSLEIPLGNKTARAGRDRARAAQEQELLRLEQLELRIIRDIRRAVDAVNTGAKVADTTAKAVEFETRKLENERTKLDLGKSTTDNVVRFIESLNSARLSHVQAVVDYNRAIVRLEQSQGTTLNPYGVTIE